MAKQKTIGIIGGVGPLATADFFQRLLMAYPAKTDQEYPHILVDCNSRIPDRTKALLDNGPSPAPELIQTAKNLIQSGAEILCLPCNTGHTWLKEIQSASSIPVINMVEEVVNTLSMYKKVGLLATDGTRAAKLYDELLAKKEIELVLPQTSDQKIVMEAIYGKKGIKAGYTQEAETLLQPVIKNLVANGAQAIILGCTELPLAITTADVPLVDSTEVLIQAVIEQSK